MSNRLDVDLEQLIFSILQEKLDEEALFQIEQSKWLQIYQGLSNNPASVIIFSILKKRNLLHILPQEVREKWEGFYYNNLKRNVLALEQIIEIQNALKETGIKFILLKGIALITSVYKNLGLRSFADIDLLVKKEDLPLIKYKLENLNYRLQGQKQASLLERFGCGDWSFLKQGLLPLDIHWQLCQYERFKGIIKFDEQKIFQDAVYIEINNNQLLTLSKEDLFLYLSMHFALVHGFSGFNWFYDLKSVIDYYKEDFNWGLLIDKAKKANLSTTLYYALFFYQKKLDSDFPSEILMRLEPSYIKRKLISLFTDQKAILRFDLTPKTGKRYYMLQGLFMDGFFNIMRVFMRMLFPSKEWLLYRGYSNHLQHLSNIIKQ